jgi:hypothetical protein
MSPDWAAKAEPVTADAKIPIMPIEKSPTLWR